jgi:hypothetical protein
MNMYYFIKCTNGFTAKLYTKSLLGAKRQASKLVNNHETIELFAVKGELMDSVPVAVRTYWRGAYITDRYRWIAV